jgi:tetratricopeptide (TPR) repeat protein
MTVPGHVLPSEPEPAGGADHIDALRRAMAGEDPGSDHEVGYRLRLADQLVDRYESAGGTRDAADLDEAIYHAKWVLSGAEALTQVWFDGRFTLLWASIDRWDLLSERADLDRAIELSADLATVVGTAFLELTHGELLVQRHDETGDAEDLAEAERALRRALAADPTNEELHQANAQLGLLALNRVRVGYGTTTTVHDLAEPIAVLERSLAKLPVRLPLRNLVLYRLGEAHTMRYLSSEFAESGGDPADELVEAIACLRDVREAGVRAPEVDYELVQALVMWHDEHPDPADRDDAISLLHELADDMDTAGLGEERAELLGQLYLARAVTENSPDELGTTIAFLERAVESASTASPILNSLLLETYGRRTHATAAERAGERRLLARMLADTTAAAMGARSGIGALHALGSMAPASLDEAIEQLREDLRAGTVDDELSASTTLLGLLAVARHVGDLVPEALRPTSMLFEQSDQLATDLLDWLERYRGRVPHAAAVDHLLAVAVLRARLTGDVEDTPVAAQEGARRSVVADLAQVLDLLADGDRLGPVVRLLLGSQHLQLCRLLESPVDAARAAELYDGALADLPEGRPLRLDAALGFTSTALACRVLGVRTLRHETAEGVLDRLADDRELTRDKRAAFRFVVGMLKTLAWLDDAAVPDLAGPVEDCAEAVALLPPGYPDRDQYVLGLAIILADRYLLTGDLGDLDAAERYLDAVADTVELALDIDDLRQRIDLLRRQSRMAGGTSSTVDHLRGQIRRYTARPGEYQDTNALALSHAHLAHALMSEAQSHGGMRAIEEAVGHIVAAERLLPTSSPLRGRVEITSGILHATLAAARKDRALFLHTIRRFDGMPVSEGSHPLTLDAGTRNLALALAWLTWSTTTGDSAALDQAIDHFGRDGLDRARLTGHLAGFAELHQTFADAAWNRGRVHDVEFALDVGMTALRALLWRVLGQSSTRLGLHQAGEAADRAASVAMRCLVVGELGRAVEAIEGGRGLVLRAGAATVGLGELLLREGLAELAGEWERAGGDDAQVRSPQPGAVPAPSALRHRVLQALRTTPSAEELTGSSDTRAIAAALRELDMDVLAYLVPGREANFGRALLVRADGELDQILLPGLRADGHGPVTDYVAARRAVDQNPRNAAALAAWHRELDSVGTWAWRQAIGPLRDRLRGTGRTPRVVLVPCGALGVVPWHAARENLLSGHRYALEDLVLSYAGSARQLVELAGRPRRALDERPVVVADPTGELISARPETRFLSGLYPSARLFGLLDADLPVTGTGTRAEVLDELAEASMMHFGCHAEGRATPATSLLRLAGGQTLTVDRLLRRAHRGGGARGATVVLAACQTDLTEDIHDEALTLSNAFVAVGATSVIGTRWAVHDLASSALMCQFHLVLRETGGRPLDALRAAQLWALDGERALPAGLPEEVVAHLEGVDLSAPALWAGFVHCGW